MSAWVTPDAFHDGAEGCIYEPLYRKRIELTAAERAILMHPALRRLQRISHLGATARLVPAAHTRYIHTLGVFALAAHLCPNHFDLRMAALLHDTGHLPFSHSAERALGLDHHHLTEQVIRSAEVESLLKQHGFTADRVIALIDGAPPNPLVCGGGGLSLDHIDSWLRDTEALGLYRIPSYQLIEKLYLDGPFLATDDPATALEVVERTVADQHVFLHPRCIGLDALITGAFETARPPMERLMQAGDEEALELCAHAAPEAVATFRLRPWAVAVRPDDGGSGRLMVVRKLYAGQIRFRGLPVAEALPEAAQLYDRLEPLLRSYRVVTPV